MRLGELLERVDVLELSGDPGTEVSAVVYDSRKAAPGSLFVAIRGEQLDGTRFIEGAIRSGACAVVSESGVVPAGAGAAHVRVADARTAMAEIAAAFYGRPSSRMRLVGITGTNGKTTTSYLVRAALESAGMKAGLIGTIGYIVGGRTLPAPNTTPESVDLQAHLRAMLDAGAACAVLEVSSHALTLKRVAACEFAVRVFTNLTQDHLDFHRTMEEYFEAKKGFFTTGEGACVVNVDDPAGRDIAKSASGRLITYGLEGDADITAADIALSPGGTEFTLRTPLGEGRVDSRLVGRHNVYNMLAAAGACISLGMSTEAVARGMAAMAGVPGRFERVEAGQDFTVLVDYAHTEDALERAATAARELTAGRLITLFGCGGDRDRTKRPRMGRVASRLSDAVVLTSDNPRSEDPARILADVEAGITEEGSLVKGEGYFVIPDRREAIRFAAGLARKGDTVLLAGKGHEDYQLSGGVKRHFDDREEAAAAIRELSAA